MCGVLRERPGRRIYALFPRRVLLELRPPRERVPRLPRRDSAEAEGLFLTSVTPQALNNLFKGPPNQTKNARMSDLVRDGERLVERRVVQRGRRDERGEERIARAVRVGSDAGRPRQRRDRF